MELEHDLNIMRDEVFRKIGKILLSFQKIEYMLKHLVANGRVSGYASDIMQTLEGKAAAVHKNTMGTLVKDFVGNTFQKSDESPDPPAELIEPYLSISYSIDADEEFFESKRQALKSLVDDRNELIHHLLPRFNEDSLESCLEINDYLDCMQERLIPEYDFLKSQIQVRNLISELHNSEGFMKRFELSLLQISPIVQLLQDISIRKPRPDGWTDLTTAIAEIRQNLPGEMEQLNINWGYKKLTDLMRASEVFDLLEVPHRNGDHRVVYRSKKSSDTPPITLRNSAI